MRDHESVMLVSLYDRLKHERVYKRKGEGDLHSLFGFGHETPHKASEKILILPVKEVYPIRNNEVNI